MIAEHHEILDWLVKLAFEVPTLAAAIELIVRVQVSAFDDDEQRENEANQLLSDLDPSHDTPIARHTANPILCDLLKRSNANHYAGLTINTNIAYARKWAFNTTRHLTSQREIHVDLPSTAALMVGWYRILSSSWLPVDELGFCVWLHTAQEEVDQILRQRPRGRRRHQ